MKWLLEQGVLIICAGGGGIPTMYARGENRHLVGVEAVVDNAGHVPSIRALRRLLLSKGDFAAAVPLFDAQIAATRAAPSRAAAAPARSTSKAATARSRRS